MFEKIKHENFNFVHHLLLFLLVYHAYLENYMVYTTIKHTNDCPANGDHSYLFGAVCELQLASYGLEAIACQL